LLAEIDFEFSRENFSAMRQHSLATANDREAAPK
jgi:hypothetical protein